MAPILFISPWQASPQVDSLMYYTNMKGGANLGPVARVSPLVLEVPGPAPIDKDCGRP